MTQTSMPKIKPLCPYFGICGGCTSQDLVYADQLAEKKRLITEAFAQAHISLPEWQLIGCDEPFYYRNRMDYPFGYRGELGLKVRGKWWKTLDLETCHLLSRETPEILCRAREWARSTGHMFWNVKTHHGLFRYLVIREGKNTGERLIMLVVSDQGVLTDQERMDFVARFDDLATSILIGVNTKITDLSIPQAIEALKGTPYLHEIVNGIRYRIQPASFFQSNTAMAAKLQQTVSTYVFRPEDLGCQVHVLDLYCGAGFFSLALAKAGAKVTGVELDAAAIEAARINAELNGINSAHFIAAKAEDYDWISQKPNVVVIDPPRAGLHPAVIETLTKALPERIVYVSCKYQKLIEELPAFLPNYRIAAFRALDLFPQTPHVEVVTLLSRI